MNPPLLVTPIIIIIFIIIIKILTDNNVLIGVPLSRQTQEGPVHGATRRRTLIINQLQRRQERVVGYVVALV